MEKNGLEELVEKYNEGLADPSEISELEKLIENGQVAFTSLKNLSTLEDMLTNSKDPVPSIELDARFYSMLKKESGKMKSSSFSWQWLIGDAFVPRLAFALTILLIGFLGGYWLSKPQEKSEVASLTREVSDLKEMVMLSLLEKESATDRLKAVSLSNEMDNASKKVTAALLQTLNEDLNVNVRLAALDALRPYTRDSQVREELIRSITIQDSPLVQVALAELMVALQEKKSVKELEKLLKDEQTPKEIKERIQESIQTLI